MHLGRREVALLKHHRLTRLLSLFLVESVEAFLALHGFADAVFDRQCRVEVAGEAGICERASFEFPGGSIIEAKEGCTRVFPGVGSSIRSRDAC
jgi:hypothetical protein